MINRQVMPSKLMTPLGNLLTQSFGDDIGGILIDDDILNSIANGGLPLLTGTKEHQARSLS